VVNLPNAITVARIAAAPLTAYLVLRPEWESRLAAWLLFLAAAITDYWDGKLARERGEITDLGRLLDPLADKLLLFCTLIPMWWLTRGVPLFSPVPDAGGWVEHGLIGPIWAGRIAHEAWPAVTPFALIGCPLWIVAIVLGREALMTVFRSLAARRGTIISAIGPAKWKTGFQSTWIGAAFFWYFVAAAAVEYGWHHPAWRFVAWFPGLVVVITMAASVGLTLYSLWLYLRRYGHVLAGGRT
jgi:phosphatidylglycerophosphate synthase